MPRWYVSFHGGDDRRSLNNIHVYATDGEPLGTALDGREMPKHVALRELRGFGLGPDGDLYVANAYREESRVLRFGGRLDDAGRHPFVGVYAERHRQNPGLDHPFDVAFGPDGTLFVPSQDTRIVVRYYGPHAVDGPPGAPMPHPPALRRHPAGAFPPGTFAPSARHLPGGLEEVRHALFGPDGDLYVADRGADRVRRYDGTTGEPRGGLGAGRLRTPIHLLFRADGALLVGSRDDDAIYACDPASGEVETLVAKGAGGLREPAGMAFGDDGALYVASRGSRQILRFDATTGRPDPKPFVDGLGDRPEFLRLVEEG